ncbi:Oxidoreductase AflY [Pleurostoma richardsiae]|uniref:Oxidoreductase AflY n=1 Tax=Pleurostoma richardsiae TaxID=41990 RepID=A0AA38RHJ4_9PEZI|nr:Oxidoreductase AflY [Pleurostoma richardsiae]
MAGLLSYVPILNRLVPPPSSSSNPSQPSSIILPRVEVHNVETSPERRPRTLKHLLRANHVNHSIIYHHLQFDNHLPHILCSAYLLGASVHQLHAIYDAEAAELEPWHDSPAEVSEADWRDTLGDRRYQRAYVDFFEDALAMRFAYDWRRVVAEYLFSGPEPLANCLVAGLGHPLIHLGYAFEMDNREVAIEALALTATQYNYLHKYLDDPKYTRPPPEGLSGAATPLELLEKVRGDARFDGLFSEPGFSNIDVLFEKHEDLVLEYWNAWALLPDPVKQFEASQEAAVALLVATVPPGTHAYNFFVVHLLTSSHAVRVVLPFVPARFHASLVRQWWLLALAVYVAQLRPRIDPDWVPEGLAAKGWSHVEREALEGRWATDAHFVKAVRAMKQAAMTWGDVHSRYLAAAVRFVDDFEGWTF